MSYIDDNLGLERANTVSTAFDGGDITENTVNAYANQDGDRWEVSFFVGWYYGGMRMFRARQLPVA